MSISSVSNQNTQTAPSQSTTPVKKVDRPNDGDADDGVKAATTPPPAQSVNTSGQKVGQLINVTA
jgi:hypothetical protein